MESEKSVILKAQIRSIQIVNLIKASFLLRIQNYENQLKEIELKFFKKYSISKAARWLFLITSQKVRSRLGQLDQVLHSLLITDRSEQCYLNCTPLPHLS